MPLCPSEDEVDDLLYFARVGNLSDFIYLANELCRRETLSFDELLSMVKDEYSGNGPLHMAAANGHTKILKAIFSNFSHPLHNPLQLSLINKQNDAGNTALHWAALNGHLESVKLLLDTGADPTIKNSAGHDPIYEAELNDKTDVVEWVLREGSGLEEGIGEPNRNFQGEDEHEEGTTKSQHREDAVDMGETVRESLHDLDMADEIESS